MDNDFDLLYETSLGSEAAFKMLFEKHKDKLFNYLIKVTKYKEVSEEIIADVFLKIWMGKELLTDVKNFEAFLYVVAKNKALDFLRIASRTEKLQKMVSRKIYEEQESGADYKIIEREYQVILENAIEQLSPKRKQIFKLSRDHGMTHEQIAHHLNLSRNTVRNTMAETLKTIRVFLQKNDIVPSVLLVVFVSS
ncbi:RNA polymerase sigma factor [Parasediminibacterium sp. JCM 36343]|uniref:RNA polymerase sigma factor n=1 Tax=Parasediminibacterium sp. JCM 36343 TaxID=3374279 RepID=UPI00397BB978